MGRGFSQLMIFLGLIALVKEASFFSPVVHHTVREHHHHHQQHHHQQQRQEPGGGFPYYYCTKIVSPQHWIIQRRRLLPSFPFILHATRESSSGKTSRNKSNSSSSAASQTVKQMASFLTMQLMEIALTNALEGGGNADNNKNKKSSSGGYSTTSRTLEELQKMTEALQKPLSETKKAQDDVEATWDAAGNAVEELLNDDEDDDFDDDERLTKLEAPNAQEIVVPVAAMTTEKSIATKKKIEQLVMEEDAGVVENEKSDATTTVEEVPLATAEMQNPVKETTIDQKEDPSLAMDDGETSTLLSPPVSLDDFSRSEVENESVSPVVESTLYVKAVTRIPSVVSMDLGRPLEVVASAVPPLKDPSLLQRRVSRANRTDNSVSKAPSDVAKTTTASTKEKVTPVKKPDEAPQNVSSSSPTTKNPVTGKKEMVPEPDTPKDEPTNSQEENDVSSPPPATKATTPTSPSSPESTPMDTPKPAPSSTAKVTEPIIDDSATQSVPPPPAITNLRPEKPGSVQDLRAKTQPSPLTTPKVIEGRFEAIVKARRQPKPPDEEAALAAKYGAMSNSVRAFAILFDLGMIECNKDPRDPGYDHSNDDEPCDQHYML